jgi:transglutaminase-like putative cysteine protease
LHLRWLLGGVLALLAVGTLFHLDEELQAWGGAASCVLLVVTFFPRLPGRVPRRLWQLGMPLIAGLFAIDLYVQEMVPAFVRLTTLLVLYRALAHRTPREDLQLLVLCLFLIVVAGVLTVSVAFAVQIVAFIAVAMVYLFVLNLVRDLRGNSEELPPPLWTLISRKRLLRRILGNVDVRALFFGGSLLVTVVALAAGIFLAMPRMRMDGTMSFFQFNPARSSTGFSDSISLGEVTDIAQNHDVAMRVDVPTGVERPTRPYWRMAVLDEYGRGTFRVSRAVQAAIGARSTPAREFVPDWWRLPHDPFAREESESWTVYLEGGVSRHLPSAGEFRRMTFRGIVEIVPNPVFGLVAIPQTSSGLFSFRIDGSGFSETLPDPGLLERELRAPVGNRTGVEPIDGERFRFRYMSYPATTLALPLEREEREYLRSIVDRLRGGENLSAVDFARRACAFLARTHDYSMQVQLDDDDPSGDPVVRWMRSGESGHCEFFAAAFTLLARTAGYPARAVTGFKGGAWNSYEHYYMVRHSDAHAWCEIYDETGAWLRVDPTPGSALPGEAPELEDAVAALAEDRSLAAYLDSLRMLWYRRIVDFDRGSQQSVLVSVRAWFAGWGADFDEATRRVASAFESWRTEASASMGALHVVFVAAVAVVFGVWIRKRGLRAADLWRSGVNGTNAARREAGRLMLGLAARKKREPRIERGELNETLAQLRLVRYGHPSRWPDAVELFRRTRRML